jgi:hypothetical protein
MGTPRVDLADKEALHALLDQNSPAHQDMQVQQ